MSSAGAAESFTVRATDHTGITVTDLDRALELWHDALGLSIVRSFELTGDFAAHLTGRPSAHTRNVIPFGTRRGSRFAYVRDPDGITLELIELVRKETP